MSVFAVFSSVNVAPNDGILKNGALLTVMSAGHALHVFVNGQFSGIYLHHIHK